METGGTNKYTYYLLLSQLRKQSRTLCLIFIFSKLYLHTLVSYNKKLKYLIKCFSCHADRVLLYEGA